MEQIDKESALFAAAEAMIGVHRNRGWSRADVRALMVHPDDEKNTPGVIFDMIWPEQP